MKSLLILLLILFVSFSALAQGTKSDLPYVQAGPAKPGSMQQIPAMQPKAASEEKAPIRLSQEPTQTSTPGHRDWTSIEIVLSVAVLFFAIIVLAIEAFIVVNAQKTWSPQSITRAFGLTMILSFSMLLIVAGYDKDQIAPAMALLGVVAGYLLGNGDRPRVSA